MRVFLVRPRPEYRTDSEWIGVFFALDLRELILLIDEVADPSVCMALELQQGGGFFLNLAKRCNTSFTDTNIFLAETCEDIEEPLDAAVTDEESKSCGSWIDLATALPGGTISAYFDLAEEQDEIHR